MDGFVSKDGGSKFTKTVSKSVDLSQHEVEKAEETVTNSVLAVIPKTESQKELEDKERKLQKEKTQIK